MFHRLHDCLRGIKVARDADGVSVLCRLFWFRTNNNRGWDYRGYDSAGEAGRCDLDIRAGTYIGPDHWAGVWGVLGGGEGVEMGVLAHHHCGMNLADLLFVRISDADMDW